MARNDRGTSSYTDWLSIPAMFMRGSSSTSVQHRNRDQNRDPFFGVMIWVPLVTPPVHITPPVPIEYSIVYTLHGQLIRTIGAAILALTALTSSGREFTLPYLRPTVMRHANTDEKV
ncbi:hypothetical protein EVAR_103636_1 [Eumeta japonica]|uniref:Uncharacterized protein n=1 Tax=Eumeta variegata TaxID=151549 RepID=A0A4C2AA89_EUMVA|nr:hypothetical protein EVAR_103636_1 [Eumeta japonica]